MRFLVMAGRWLLPVALLMTACSQGEVALAQTRDVAQAPPQAQDQVRERLGSVPAAIDTAAASALSSAFRGAADRALPAVVYVAVEQTGSVATSRQVPQVPDEFRRFFQFPDEMQQQPQRGNGSGFIIDEQGHIVTNNHVVEGATRVAVRLVDGRQFEANVVGTDPATDIALLKVDPGREKLPVAAFGDSDQLRIGDWVLALGNPLGLDFSVTAGIVSAKGRNLSRIGGGGGSIELESFIQTDAAINMGNSGGPLVDLLGRVVGVNTAIMGGGSRFVGYGFAVPGNLASKVVGDLKEYGHARRPKLGAWVAQVAPADREAFGLSGLAGAHVKGVEPGEPAARAGLRPGDVVVSLDGEAITDDNHLILTLARHQPGDRVRLTIVRDGKQREVTVALGEFPRAEMPRRVVERGEPTEQLLGFAVSALTPRLAQEYGLDQRSGVVITGVAPLSAAFDAGVRAGHVLLEINKQPVQRPEDVARIAASIEPGAVVSLRLRDPQIGETLFNYYARR